MAGREDVDPVQVVRELLEDALELARGDVEAIYAAGASTNMAAVLHFRDGVGFEFHVHPPNERHLLPPARVVRRRRRR